MNAIHEWPAPCAPIGTGHPGSQLNCDQQGCIGLKLVQCSQWSPLSWDSQHHTGEELRIAIMHGVFSTCCTPLSAFLHIPFQALISPHSGIYFNDLHRPYTDVITFSS